MLSRREIENILYTKVEDATRRHQSAREELGALSKALHRELGDAWEEDPQIRNAENTLRNARLALLAALQKYNDFVSGGVVPHILKSKRDEKEGQAVSTSEDASALAGK